MERREELLRSVDQYLGNQSMIPTESKKNEPEAEKTDLDQEDKQRAP